MREPIETAIHGALRGGPGFVDFDGEIRRNRTEFLMAGARKARGATGTIVGWPVHALPARTYRLLSSSTERLRDDLLDNVSSHENGRKRARRRDEKYSTKTPVTTT